MSQNPFVFLLSLLGDVFKTGRFMSAPSDPNFVQPAPRAARSALPFILSVVMLLIYFGFILLVAFKRPLMGTAIVPGLSWGILLGALVIVSAWVLTLIYVLSFNKKGGR